MVVVHHEGPLSEDLLSILKFNLSHEAILLITDDNFDKSQIPEDLQGNLEVYDNSKLKECKYYRDLTGMFEPLYCISEAYQFRTFRRAFSLISLLKSGSFKNGFYHMDSDTLLLQSTENLRLDNLSYFKPSDFGNKYRMGHSIHFSKLTEEFADILIDEFNTFYLKKERDWAEEKFKFHQESGIIGEVCDMNFYYRVSQRCNVTNLMVPSSYDNEDGDSVFDFNISLMEGPGSKDYWLGSQIKNFLFDENGRILFGTSVGKTVRALSLHLQGTSKSLVKHLIL